MYFLVCEKSDLFQLDYCCSPRSLESVEDRANYSFIRVRAAGINVVTAEISLCAVKVSSRQ